MQISVTGRHLEITDAIREYAHEHVVRALQEFPRVISAHMILDVEKYRRMAELVITAPHHVKVEAKTESDDMYASIDGACEKVEKQLRRLRDKVQHHKAGPKLALAELARVQEQAPEQA